MDDDWGYPHVRKPPHLVAGLEHQIHFFIQSGFQSSQLTFMFLRGVETTNQIGLRTGDHPIFLGDLRLISQDYSV